MERESKKKSCLVSVDLLPFLGAFENAEDLPLGAGHVDVGGTGAGEPKKRERRWCVRWACGWQHGCKGLEDCVPKESLSLISSSQDACQ